MGGKHGFRRCVMGPRYVPIGPTFTGTGSEIRIVPWLGLGRPVAYRFDENKFGMGTVKCLPLFKRNVKNLSLKDMLKI